MIGYVVTIVNLQGCISHKSALNLKGLFHTTVNRFYVDPFRKLASLNREKTVKSDIQIRRKAKSVQYKLLYRMSLIPVRWKIFSGDTFTRLP